MHDGRFGKRHALVSGKRWIARLALASPLALAACVQPAVPTISADGDYRGTTTRSQFPQRRTCPHPGPVRLHVQAGVTFYRWENQYIRVSVLNNGTMSGALPGVQLSGTHDGTTMQGNVTDGQCWLYFTLKRVET